jgi:hypothetical protein
VGVGTQPLDLDWVPCPWENDFDGFLAELAHSAEKIELKCLKLSELGFHECHELAEFISATSSLQELELNGIDDAYPILCSLQSNGTLHAVSIPGEIESKLASSYGFRNERIGELVGNLSTEDVDRSTKAFLPTLLETTKQVSKTRTSTLFSSLMSLRESIGPIP